MTTLTRDTFIPISVAVAAVLLLLTFTSHYLNVTFTVNETKQKVEKIENSQIQSQKDLQSKIDDVNKQMVKMTLYISKIADKLKVDIKTDDITYFSEP